MGTTQPAGPNSRAMCMGFDSLPCSSVRMLAGASLPPRLNDLPAPPERMFLHGNLPGGHRVGVVGTRRASAEALEFATSLAGLLASHGVTVVSGGAKGIDAAAHRGALAASGKTLVVAPSSLDCPFPAEHRDLYAEIIASGGGYLSRFESGASAQRASFLERNGILVALCDALVLVEAPLKSGARNASAWARQLDRPCFVVPSAPWHVQGRGCIVELQLGARALGNPAEILEFLRVPRQAEGARVPAAGGADGAEFRATESRAAECRAAECRAAVSRAASSREAASPTAASGEAAYRAVESGEAESRQALASTALPVVTTASGEEEMAAAVLAALARGARYADDVAEALGIDLSRVNHALLLLMLSGDVHQGPGGALTRAPR